MSVHSQRSVSGNLYDFDHFLSDTHRNLYMTDPFPLGRLCAVHTITSLQYSVSGSSMRSEGRKKWPLGAKPSDRSSEENASSSRQPLHTFSPPPEGTAACIPRHQAGRLGWILQKRARRTVRGEQAQGNSGHEQIRAEAGTREAEREAGRKAATQGKRRDPGEELKRTTQEAHL